MNSPPYSPGYKTREQIAAEYGVSVKTLIEKLKAEGITLPPGRVSLIWQKRIYDAMGYPPGVPKKDFADI